jgi:hypothetical protein
MSQALCVVVKCPDCLETRLGPEAVTLRHCLDDESWQYRFTCPQCHLPSVSATGDEAARAAMEAGCPIEIWRLPSELLEPHAGPPIVIADLLELHEEMLQPDWFDAFVPTGDDR